MSVLTKDDAARAVHTLWQAAGGYAAATVVVQDYVKGDSHDARLALIAAGTAVGGAVLSIAKAQAVKAVAAANRWLKSRHVPLDLDYDAVESVGAVAVADVAAGDSVAQVATDVARSAGNIVRVDDPYLAA